LQKDIDALTDIWHDIRDIHSTHDAKLQQLKTLLETDLRGQKVIIFETIVKPPGLSSPCTMQGGEGLLTAFGVGFTPPVQRQARTDLLVRPPPVDTLLHLAIAPVAPLHGIRGEGQQLVIEKREGLCQRGGKELLQCLPPLAEPLEPTP
jgi:hypothetical protein